MKKLSILFTLLITTLFAQSQNVGIGTNTPAEKLDVAGSIKTTGEIKPNGVAGQAGQVLTSAGNGTMQWTAAAASSGNNNGGWGDCSIYNIDSYFAVANSNGKINDHMGTGVAIAGEYAIVGTYGDDEFGLTDHGSATVYKINTATGAWESQGKIVNVNMAAGDYFGVSVAMSGDYAIVGASKDDEGGFTDNGSATVFIRLANGIWSPVTKLVNTNPGNDDYFGFRVAISGEYAIVGAYNDSEGGLNNNGSASFYKRNTTTGVWEFQNKVLNLSPANNDKFGCSVAISGDYAIVGADLDLEGVMAGGTATIFKRNSASGLWEPQVKLLGSSQMDFDFFGHSVAISGNIAVVGARFDDEDGLIDNGSVSFYKRNTTTGVWESLGKYTNANTDDNDQFGSSVAMNGDYVMVGASYDDEEGLVDCGSVTLFRRYENILLPYQKFHQPSKYHQNKFGAAVSIDPVSNRFVVGAPGTSNYANIGMALFGRAK